ncbi:MAG: hypothetical protein WAK55_04310 [Xanthobacteraceae bacterium]
MPELKPFSWRKATSWLKTLGKNSGGVNVTGHHFQEREMADANLYSMDGKHSFYQNGKYFYSAENGEYVFYRQGTSFYSTKTRERFFYQDGECLYSIDGVAKYYFR